MAMLIVGSWTDDKSMWLIISDNAYLNKPCIKIKTADNEIILWTPIQIK